MATRPARARRCRPDRRRHRAGRLVPPGPSAQRRRLRHARRGCAASGLLGDDHQASSQPPRRSAPQLRSAHHRNPAATSRPSDQGVLRAAPRRGQDRPRDPSLRQARHRPQALPHPRALTANRSVLSREGAVTRPGALHPLGRRPARGGAPAWSVLGAVRRTETSLMMSCAVSSPSRTESIVSLMARGRRRR